MNHSHLAHHITQLIVDLPVEVSQNVVAALGQSTIDNWPRLRTRVLSSVSQPDVQARVASFLDVWQQTAPQVPADAVALAVLSASHTNVYHQQRQQMELVWTGPDSQVIPLRRTDQALLQLIRQAEKSVHIVSFAVYRIEAVAQALINAARRGVSISIYLETPDAGEGQISYNTVAALGNAVAQRAQLYIWPQEKRPLAENGRAGSLHAKMAVADGNTLFVSSANLTAYAMTLNMEMGLLVRGGPLPVQAERHLQQLVQQGDFQFITQTNKEN